MAQIIRWVDPDVVGGAGDGTSLPNAYSSLNAWEAAEQADLDAANNYMTCRCLASLGGDDTSQTLIDGWNPSATDYIEVIGFDFPSDGIWDETKYLVHNNNVDLASAIRAQEDYVRLINIQCKVTCAGTNACNGLVGDNTSGEIRVDSCISKCVPSGSGQAIGFFGLGDAIVNFYNCISISFISGGDTSWWGFRGHTGTNNFLNCTAWGNYIGFYRSGGTMTCKNCVSGNNTDDFSGTITIDFCCSDDGDGTNSQGPLDGDWTKEFFDTGNDDFALVSGGNCINNGTNDPGSGLYSDDIIGSERA